MTLSDRLKVLRKERGLTVEKLCDKLEFKLGTYRHYESGDREPNSFALLKISHFFEVTTDYLLTGKEFATKHTPIPSQKGLRIGRLYDIADDHDQQTVEHILSRYDEYKKGIPSANKDEKNIAV